MRFVLFTPGLTLALIACARNPLDASPVNCGSGEEACGATCVPKGSCSPDAGTTSTASATATATSTTLPSSNCTDKASLQKKMTTQYDGAFLTVNGSNKQYYVQSNWWSKFVDQTVAVDGLSYTLGNPNNRTADGSDPMGYPSFFIGSYSGNSTAGSNLPKQVSALTKVPTVLSTNAKSKGTSNYNASYDVWFTASGAPLSSFDYSPGPGGAYLMVWLFMPSDRQPRGGGPHARGQKVGSLPGTWDVWVDSSNPPCISYVSTTQIETLDFDLNQVIQDAVTKGYGITSSMYLSIIFGGFEVWGGADGLQLEAFCASVQ